MAFVIDALPCFFGTFIAIMLLIHLGWLPR